MRTNNYCYLTVNLSARFLQLALSNLHASKFGQLYTIPMASNNGYSFSGTQPINVLLFLQLGRALQYNVASHIFSAVFSRFKIDHFCWLTFFAEPNDFNLRTQKFLPWLAHTPLFLFENADLSSPLVNFLHPISYMHPQDQDQEILVNQGQVPEQCNNSIPGINVLE